jgi:hypothetical protein
VNQRNYHSCDLQQIDPYPKGEITMLSREQQAVSDFMDVSTPLLRIADDGHNTGLQNFADAIVHSIAFFGLSELHARQAERGGVLNVQSSKTLSASRMSTHYNDKGLKTLSFAQDALKEFKEELANYPKSGDLRASVDTFQQELREALADLDLKASDVTKIDEAIQPCLDIVRSQGADELVNYLEEQVGQLEEVRRRPDRGAVENIPIWKVVAIVVAVGVWVWALFRCGIFRGCSRAEGLAYFVIFWLAVLISRFC